jgi:3-deoxy-D-manno-octulosonic-acid transferase
MPTRLAVRLWYGIYFVLIYLGALVCLPYWIFVRLSRGRYRGQFAERMGILAPELRAKFGQRPSVWVHAASAGETASAAPLVRLLRDGFADGPFLFTVTSRYGKEMAERLLGGVVDAISFSPLDLPLFVRRFLSPIRPRLYVTVESEIWPSMLRMAKRSGAAVVLASGHAGPASFPRPFWQAVFSHVDLFCMQTEADAANIRRRGAPADRIVVTGNMKFDSTAAHMEEPERARWRAELGLPVGAPVLVAGSTLLEDEGPVLDTAARLRADGLDLHLVVAPRRQERVAEVVKGCEARSLPYARRSEGGSAPVLILDTMGELARTYNLADVAYVGGGLTPDVGLHNILEPAVCGVPVLFGPHLGKAARVASEFRKREAGVEISDGAALPGAVSSILTDQAARDRLREAGRALLADHRGAARRQADRILELVA